MLKRKRPSMAPPPSYSASSSYSRKPPAEPQPEKAVEKFEASHAEVMRALKKARVFDQQRLVKKIQEEKEPDKVKGKRKGKPKRKPSKKATGANADAADADGTTEATTPLNTDLIARLERELAVIKTLDMEITARVHLAHAMSRIKALVDAPGPLAAHLQVAEVLATRSKAARTEDTHNVTSSLYNKPFVRDAVAKAVKEMCQLMGVSDKKLPLKKKDKKGKQEETEGDKPREKKNKDAKDDSDVGDINYDDDDDDEIERELAKFDAMLGGDDKQGSDEEEESDDDEDAEISKLRAKYKRALAKGLIADDARDDYSGEEDESEGFGEDGNDSEEESEEGSDEGSDKEEEEEEEEEEQGYSSESEVEKRPRKRAAAAAPSAPGASNFLPSLMGGYLADAGDNSDGYGSDEAQRDERAAAKMLGVVRKNRRGQRARQAIWEKKYKAEAKHIIEEKLNPKPVKVKDNKKAGSKSAGWDAKRGAVDANDAPRWLRRKLGMGSKPGFSGSNGGGHSAPAAPAPPKKNENANKQVSGTLHPSWEAARKAKEQAQTAEYKGTKIVFD